MRRKGPLPRRAGRVSWEWKSRRPLDQSGEGAALSAAIQRLIAERDRHKSLAAAQESELVRLKAINEELRRQNEEISLTRDRYLGLAAELLTQLQEVDTAIQDALHKSRKCVGERRRGHFRLRAPLLPKAEPGRRYSRLRRTVAGEFSKSTAARRCRR